MEYITWYALSLKAWMMRKTSWLMTVGLVAIIILVQGIHIPDAENTKVGVCVSDDIYGAKIGQTLVQADSIFEFVICENDVKLQEDIEAGHVECGFIFDEDFENLVRNGQTQDVITYLCTPMTVKGEVAQETVFAAFLQIYGETVLYDSEPLIFGSHDEERMALLLEKYQYYLENSSLFTLNTEIVDVSDTEITNAAEFGTAAAGGGNAADVKENANEGAQVSVFPIQGLAGLLLFLIMWFNCGRKFEKTGCSVYAALNTRQRNVFEFCGYLASVTVPAVISLVLILCMKQRRGVMIEAAAMIFFIWISALWVLAVGRCFKNSTTFAAWALTIVLIQAVICPVFVDLAQYVPALYYIRRLLPLGWYLFAV